MRLKYVERFLDRHGKERFYFTRQVAGDRVRIPLPPIESDAFARAYTKLLGMAKSRLRDEAARRALERKVADQITRTANRRGFVYVIAKSGVVKIGFAVKPSRRLAALQTGSPERLALLATISCHRSLERQLHQRFSEHRISGEWFIRHPEIDAWIGEITSGPAQTAIPNPKPEALEMAESR